MKFGLIGYPVSHSLSPVIFQAAFEAAGVDARYDLHPVAPEDLDRMIPELVAAGLRGFNVTVPHKLAVIPMMKSLDESAVLTGAVNTVLVTDEGLVGYNTDMGGFGDSLQHLGVPDIEGSTVLVLGAGGAARAVVASLGSRGAATIVIANKFLEETIRAFDVLPGQETAIRVEGRWELDQPGVYLVRAVVDYGGSALVAGQAAFRRRARSRCLGTAITRPGRRT